MNANESTSGWDTPLNLALVKLKELLDAAREVIREAPTEGAEPELETMLGGLEWNLGCAVEHLDMVTVSTPEMVEEHLLRHLAEINPK